jgi:hypothetical protein
VPLKKPEKIGKEIAEGAVSYRMSDKAEHLKSRMIRFNREVSAYVAHGILQESLQ